MKKIFCCVLAIPLLLGISFSQNLKLKPSIGIGPLPSDADSICPIPTYTGGFDTSGLQTGDTIADFTLYNLNGDSMNIKDKLQKGKPVLLVAGSYTCPVFRNKIPEINKVINTYGTDISVFIIYVIEAHPDTDISPYFGFVNTTSANINAGILYRQPVTYGARKAIVSDMLSAMSIDAPVYMDGPCNNWWEYFGPAPNNSYLIDTNGIVFSKHAWFDKYPDDIFCDIDSLLGTTGNCSGATNNGQFTFSITGSNFVTGLTGTTIYAKGELKNNSTENVLIEVQRTQMTLPAGWQSSMCTDVCLSPTTDSTTVFLAPNDSQLFTIYFYTDSIPDSGMVRVGFRNMDDLSNSYTQNFYGITEPPLVKIPEMISSKRISISLFPNPFSKQAVISIKYPVSSIQMNNNLKFTIYDLSGVVVHEQILNTQYSILNTDLPAGMYFYSLYNETGLIGFGKMVVN